MMNEDLLAKTAASCERAEMALGRRLQVVQLRQQGMTFRHIAEPVCMSPESVSAIWRRFAVGGVEALADRRLTPRQPADGTTDRDTQIRSLCERGWTTAAISVELNVAESTINKALRRHGVARPDRGLARRLEVIRLRTEQGLTVMQTAKAVGLHETSVRGILRRFDEAGVDALRHKAFKSADPPTDVIEKCTAQQALVVRRRRWRFAQISMKWRAAAWGCHAMASLPAAIGDGDMPLSTSVPDPCAFGAVAGRRDDN